ncbi:sulfotransferase domain-containing protein [Nitrogeniibacter aestuarii]|uniref:sulfotransferase domain-containing protein n=1 Tax=Nitrogeniibacter aestuarii TaxID=2815343 RepID=UPI001E62DFFD|nr:sulfotransferase domain-containing protein [Nitrogeniibacter aestuarii]
MKKPNFFLVGAPKSGTTSLANWLEEHPEVCFSKVKEPDYFSTDFVHRHGDSLNRYESYFDHATDRHIAVGEGSTGYLRSFNAVPNILSYNSAARFIVCLRNPMEMAPSWHGQMCYVGYENVDDFSAAWRLNEARRSGLQVPALCPDPKHLCYDDVCRVGSQLERLAERVPSTQLLVLFQDDLRVRPAETLRRVLDFLEVDSRFDCSFTNANEARRVPKWVSHVSRVVVDSKRRLGITGGLGLVSLLNRKTAQKGKSMPSADCMREMAAVFASEIDKVEHLTGRDLADWRTAMQ